MNEWRTITATVTGIERFAIPRKCIAQCDQCGDQYLGGDGWAMHTAENTAKNEAKLRDDGWLTPGSNQHICPSCQ